MRGHAIEARIYAEDPDRGFLPQTGEVLHWRPDVEGRPGVRIDGGIREGQEIGAHYDSMLAKIIAGGETREIARRKLIAAIEDTPLLGLTTNRPFLVELLHDPVFVEGEVTTSYVDGREASPGPPGPELAALAAVLVSRPSSETWRSSGEPAWPVFLVREGERIEVRLTLRGEGGHLARIGEEELVVEVIDVEDHAVRCAVDGVLQRATFVHSGQELFLELGGRPARFTLHSASAARGEGGKADARLTAPLSGQVVSVRVEVGARVEPGQCVAVLEAMKMEHRIVASAAGEVAAVAVAEGDQVKARQLIVELVLDIQHEE
jgi:geranyl-CoA carboxylase alpha subunit